MDTNAVVDFFNGKLPAKGKYLMAAQQPAISVITHIELLSNKNIPPAEWAQMQNFISSAFIYALESQIVQQTIALRQQHKIKTPDAIIAATALTYNLKLITRNIADFKNISKLTVINPHLL